ncbi:MAG: histidinol-phosphate transaminase [Candidatus Nitrotoga sp.]|jgi:histidinol-phosphate aminotransferase|nr:histidinol-phosphate transaminase [Candidatus Nitrotoga sp.]MBP0119133.1 histidinol-phosphate transaminase [Candidatus Nitrotoga sp.]
MSSVRRTATPDSLLRQEVLDMQAYSTPDSVGMIKLDAMENPYPLPQWLSEQIASLAAGAAINRYPDADPRSLKDVIRTVIDLPRDLDILLGNGSDEIIQLLALATAKQNAVLLSVEPSFVMYKMIAAFTGMQYVGVPLANDFTLDVPALLAAIEQQQPALMFLSYPNNPSGNLFDAQAMARIIEAAPGLVVVDEAYYNFADSSFLPMIKHHPNLLVMRTFSKLGMAGLRLGFLAGSKTWLGQLEKLRLPYNISVLTQLVAEQLLRSHDVLQSQAEQIKRDRVMVYEHLEAIDGVQPYPSAANFILFRVRHAGKIFQGLKERGVLIKDLSRAHPLLSDCLRVTIGTPQENECFVQALQESVRQCV